MRNFPDINEIKLLEKNSQKNGSGIVHEELLGIWKFKYVWGKESDEIKNIPSSILQVLSARLELKSKNKEDQICLLYTSPSPRDISGSRMPSSA